AVPLIKPGKSLKFASLPEGQDPDDLARSSGREAINEVVGAARPLSAMLWMRETEAGAFDTPERRAAFEARIMEVTAAIGDDAVRKHYSREFEDRLRRLFDGDRRPQPRSARGRMANSEWRTPGRPGKPSASRQGSPTVRPFSRGEPYVVASAQLASSPVHRGHRAAIPR